MNNSKFQFNSIKYEIKGRKSRLYHRTKQKEGRPGEAAEEEGRGVICPPLH